MHHVPSVRSRGGRTGATKSQQNPDALKRELHKSRRTNGDLKQEVSELQEKLRVLVTDKEEP